MKNYFKVMLIGILAIIGLLVSTICSVWLGAPAVVTAGLAIAILLVVWGLEDLEDMETAKKES